MRAAKQRGKKKSLASSAAADFFSGSLPASCGALTLSGCVHAANPSPLPAIRRKPEPRLPAPARPSGGADKPLGLVSAARRRASVQESLRFSLCTPVAVGSMLIAEARARLWSSFRQHSESPLLVCRETKRQEKVSCLFGSCRLYPGLPPGSLWCANPFRLCSRSQPQSSPCDPTEARASAPSPHPPRRLSRQASRAGECYSAPIL